MTRTVGAVSLALDSGHVQRQVRGGSRSPGSSSPGPGCSCSSIVVTFPPVGGLQQLLLLGGEQVVSGTSSKHLEGDVEPSCDNSCKGENIRK